MDDHQVVDHAVPVRVELCKVHARVGGLDGLGDETVDWSVRVVDPAGTVRAVIRHRMDTVKPHREDGRVDAQRASRDLLVIRTNRVQRASHGIQAVIEIGPVVGGIRGDVGEVDEKDDHTRDARRLRGCG